MTLILLKLSCKKQRPRINSNRNYKNINNSVFREHVKIILEKPNLSEFSLKDFKDSFLLVLNHFIPIKKKYARANKSSFMNFI